MKIYTKTGDNGKTSLYDGRRIDKNTVVFDVIGELDELTARLGMAVALCDVNHHVANVLRTIQCKIQDINSILATIDKEGKKLPSISEEDVKYLETHIDDYSMVTPKLKAFILPGVTKVDAQIHLCRTQARKCERGLFGINKTEEVLLDHRGKDVDLSELVIDPVILKYVNRLSDLMFAMSRYLCHTSGCKDVFISDFSG